MEDARELFRNSNMDRPFINYDDEDLMFTWAGTKTNRTISLIAQLFLDKIIGFNHIFLNGLNTGDIFAVLKHQKPKAESLCPYLMRFFKERKKYDYLLSDELLDIQYASMYLDVDRAWCVLTELSEADGKIG